MQKWGKRPIYFKNAEIMQNALIMQTLRPLKLCKFTEIVWPLTGNVISMDLHPI